jgi:hypothetical protein
LRVHFEEMEHAGGKVKNTESMAIRGLILAFSWSQKCLKTLLGAIQQYSWLVLQICFPIDVFDLLFGPRDEKSCQTIATGL